MLCSPAGPGGEVATALAIAEAHTPIAYSHDAREGVSACFERRAPHSQGR